MAFENLIGAVLGLHSHLWQVCFHQCIVSLGCDTRSLDIKIVGRNKEKEVSSNSSDFDLAFSKVEA